MRTLGKLLTGLLFLRIGNCVVADEPVRNQTELVQAAPEETATQSTETLATETLATKAPAAPVEASGFVDALVNGKVKALFRYSGQTMKDWSDSPPTTITGRIMTSKLTGICTAMILRQRPKISMM